jgi:hypothetical protein
MENIQDVRTLVSFLPNLSGKSVIQLGNDVNFLNIFREQNASRLVLVNSNQINVERDVEFVQSEYVQLDLTNQK